MGEDNFNWNNNESVVVEPMEAIAVYTNPKGDIVIRQQRGYPDEDVFVVIPRSRVEDVVTALGREASRAQ